MDLQEAPGAFDPVNFCSGFIGCHAFSVCLGYKRGYRSGAVNRYLLSS